MSVHANIVEHMTSNTLRMSTMFLRTLREDPADADVDSAKLLQRAGYIRKAAPGIWTWLPLGLRVLNKIEAIIREEINGIGAQEVHFPALLPREPYEATHRWEEYGDNIFRLKDRHEADYLLAPAHEEMFTLLVKDMYSSYKDLPVTLYQIQTKYRDEFRPRAGLIRGREFVMKDAYSFTIDEEGMRKAHDDERGAYERIFQRLDPEVRTCVRHVRPDGRLRIRGVPGSDADRRRYLRAGTFRQGMECGGPEHSGTTGNRCFHHSRRFQGSHPGCQDHR